MSVAVRVRRSKGPCAEGVWTADSRITSRPDGVTFMTQFIAASSGLAKFTAHFGTTENRIRARNAKFPKQIQINIAVGISNPTTVQFQLAVTRVPNNTKMTVDTMRKTKWKHQQIT